jgi:hypothetical protein
MMNREEGATAASTAAESTRDSLIYGELHLPPPPQLWLRLPELHEADEEDDTVPDPAAGIRHLSPGMNAIRH